MSAHPTSNIPTRTIAIVGSIIASLAFTGVASADEPTVTVVDGNPTCASIDPSFFEVKVDNIREGRTVFGDGSTSGSVTAKGLLIDWSATPGIDAVIVKGGDNANVYRADDEMTSGAGQHAPINPNTGRPYGLSHVTFCSDRVDGAPRVRAQGAPAPCEPGGPATMADGTPCAAPAAPQGQVLAAHASGGRPEATAQMSAPSACVSKSYVTLVRGKGIRKVTLFANGKRIRTISGSRARYAVTVNPKAYRSGVMRLKARVEFVAASGRRPQTFNMTVLRCAKSAVQQAPAFTG